MVLNRKVLKSASRIYYYHNKETSEDIWDDIGCMAEFI